MNRSLIRYGILSATLAMAAAGEGYYPPAATGGNPMIGVEMSPVPLDVQGREGLTNNQGVLVRQIFPDTAASRMGVQPGDVILAVNGGSIGSMTDLRNSVSSNRVGDPLQLVVSRGGRQVNMNGVFDQWPSNIPFTPLDPAAEQQYRDWQGQRLERSRDDIQRVRQELSEMRQALTQAREQAANAVDPNNADTGPSQAVRQAISYLALLPAWHLGLGQDLDDQMVRHVVPPPLTVTDPLPAKAADEVAWVVHFSSGTPRD